MSKALVMIAELYDEVVKVCSTTGPAHLPRAGQQTVVVQIAVEVLCVPRGQRRNNFCVSHSVSRSGRLSNWHFWCFEPLLFKAMCFSFNYTLL